MIKNVVVIVVTHPSRRENVDKIAAAVDGTVICVVDHHGQGASAMHKYANKVACRMCNEDTRAIIMEDDAIPVVGFAEKALAAINKYPDKMVSFYLGTSRPANWQLQVDNELAKYPAAEVVRLPKLIHGVCYTMPEAMYSRVSIDMNTKRPADFAVSESFINPEVIYLVRSLVQHADGPSVESHADAQLRTEKRVARFLAGELSF